MPPHNHAPAASPRTPRRSPAEAVAQRVVSQRPARIAVLFWPPRQVRQVEASSHG